MNPNLESFFELVKFAPRQRTAFLEFFQIIGDFFKNFSFKSVTATFVILGELLGCMLLDTPVTPHGAPLELTGYQLVFEDEFEGNTLNTDVWRHWAEGPRRFGYNAASQARVYGGHLVLRGEYRQYGDYGPGWYVGAVALKRWYKQGYFEIRCRCNAGGEFWSAFWIQAKHPYDHELSRGGVGGAEIDIFESMGTGNTKWQDHNAVTSTIHCNGFDDDPENIDSNTIGKFNPGGDITADFNTYGVKWTEDEYIFYINGVESGRTSFAAGVSQVEEEVIVSLEIPDEITHPTDFTTSMAVDYVRIYQETGE